MVLRCTAANKITREREREWLNFFERRNWKWKYIFYYFKVFFVGKLLISKTSPLDQICLSPKCFNSNQTFRIKNCEEIKTSGKNDICTKFTTFMKGMTRHIYKLWTYFRDVIKERPLTSYFPFSRKVRSVLLKASLMAATCKKVKF